MNLLSRYTAVMLVSLLITACSGGGSNSTQVENQVTTIEGIAQKGTFQTGSSITFEQVKLDGSLSGLSKKLELSQPDGSFQQTLSWNDWTLSSIKGSYFNECNGKTSSTPITLRAYSKSPKEVANINLMTHLMAARIDHLVENGMSLNKAWEKAQQDTQSFFKIETSPLALNAYDGAGTTAADNAVLLLLSGAYTCHEERVDITKLASDFSDNTSFDNEAKAVFEEIKNTAQEPKIIDSFVEKLKEAASITNPPDSADLGETPIWVAPPNQAPIGNAGTSQTVNAGDTVKLDGSNSSDADGVILKYKWAYLKNDASLPDITLDAATTATPTFVAPMVSKVTTLTFALVVIDDDSAEGTEAFVTITINPAPQANKAPTAHAGQSQTVYSDAKVELDGSASSDADGSITNYSWVQTDGTSISLLDAKTATPKFDAPTVATDTVLTFQLTVTDDQQATDTAEVKITIKPPQAEPNNPPIARVITQVYSVYPNMPDPIFDGSTSADVDASGHIIKYTWKQIDGPAIELLNKDSAKPTFPIPNVTEDTTYVFELVVIDNGNVASTPVTVTVYVHPLENDPPIASAGQNQTVSALSVVTLDGSGSNDPDADDDIKEYHWSQKSGSPTVTLNNPNSAQPSFTAPDVSESTVLTFSLTVINDKGVASTPDTTQVTIQPTPNTKPIAAAGNNQTVTGFEIVTLDGSASNDPDDGDTIRYSWTQTGGGPTVTLANPTSAQASFSAPSVINNTVLEFTLIVTDSHGLASEPATVEITVEPLNQNPIANAGPAQTVQSGATVQLDGSASSDPDFTEGEEEESGIQLYAWSQTGGSSVSLSDATAAKPTFTAPTVTEETVLTFSLVVTDNFNAESTPDTVEITVQPVQGTAPTANAGSDQSIISGTVVNLSASGSSDASSYSWTQTGGSPTVNLQNSDTATPSFTAPSIATSTTLTFTLTATNSHGSNTDTVDITITPITSSLLINEVSSSNFGNAERWFEIFNNSSQSIDLSNYTVKSLAISTENSRLTSSVSFTLPNITIPAGSYIAFISNHRNRVASANNEQVQYLKNTSNQVPFWDTLSKLGYLELLHNNQTVDYVAIGQRDINTSINYNGDTITISAPTDSNAWTGASPVPITDGSNNFGWSLARSATHEDTNTVSDWTQRTYSTLAGPNDVTCNADSDGDGIPDCSEQQGSTYAGIDLYALGARTGQKDLFIEVDYMDATRGGVEPDTNKGMIPHQQALSRIKSVMANKGYHVHFDVGDLFDQNTGINPNKMDLGGGNEVPYEAMMQMCDPTIQGSTIHEIKNVHMNPVRRSIFYYMLFAYSQDNANPAQGFIAGCGETPGNDLLITMGKAALDTDTQVNTYNLINKQSSTVMHELGHNLGLKHGGHEDQQYKPNYLSVMNYLYSGFGLPTVGNNEGDRYHHAHNTTCKTDLVNPPTVEPSNFGLDFSDGSSAEIDENSINEAAGFGRSGSTGIDFNCDGQLTTGVSKNLNPGRTGDTGKSTLQDHNDWGNLQLFFAKRFEQDVYPLMITADGKVVDNPINHHLPDPTWNDVQPVTPEPLTPIH